MIKINKEEAQIVREVFPDAELARTMKQDSKRHHYYLAEDERYCKLIAKTNTEAKRVVDENEARRRRKFGNTRGGRRYGR